MSNPFSRHMFTHKAAKSRSNPYSEGDLTNFEIRQLEDVRECIGKYFKLFDIQSDLDFEKRKFIEEWGAFSGGPTPRDVDEYIRSNFKWDLKNEEDARQEIETYLQDFNAETIQEFLTVPPGHDPESYLRTSLDRVNDLLWSMPGSIGE